MGAQRKLRIFHHCALYRVNPFGRGSEKNPQPRPVKLEMHRSKTPPHGLRSPCRTNALLGSLRAKSEGFGCDGSLCKRRTPLHFGSGVHWLRGVDLNHRPLGYENEQDL